MKRIPIIRERSFYKAFLSMFIILLLQNVITLAVNLADNMMLGGYNELALAGVATVNQIQVIYQQLLIAVGEGIVILGSQYFAQGKAEPIKTISAHAMRTALVICLILFAAVSLFPAQILGLFTTDAEIIASGCTYMYIIRFTYFFFFVTQILLSVLRSVGTVKIALTLSISTLIINCGINYILIYGHFGAPEMGIRGAAIGTLVARIVEVIILIIFILKKETFLKIKLKDFLQWDKLLRGDYVKVFIPMLLINGLWGFNLAAQNAILGHMTANAITANSIATTLSMLLRSGAMGAAACAAFFTGKTVGEGDWSKLKAYKNTVQIMFVVIGVINGLLFFFLRIPVLSFYNLTPETRELANTFMILMSFVAVGTAYQMPTNMGVIRGGGSPKFTMKLDLISIWCIVMPLSLILAFGVKASPVVVLFGLTCDQFFKAIPIFIKVNFGHWAKKLTR